MHPIRKWFRRLASASRTAAAQTTAFRPGLERLEDRTLMAVDFTALASSLDSRLGVIDGALGGASGIVSQATTPLPVLNTPLSGLTAAQHAVQDVRTQLASAVRSLQGLSDGAQAQDRIYSLLGPGGVGILGNTNGDKDASGKDLIDRNDVAVAFANGGNDVQISLRLSRTVDAGAFSFGLGLPGIPLRLTTGNALKTTVGFDYSNLTFGVRGGNFTFDTSRPDELKLSVDATLAVPEQSGTLGFLHVTASDRGTGLHVTLVTDVTDGGLVNPRLNESADVRFHLTAAFATASTADWRFPSITAEFHAGWAGFGSDPTVEFSDVQIGLGTYLGSVVKPIVGAVQTVTKPLQPILTVLNASIPGLSDLSKAIGSGDVSLMTLAKVAAATGALPPDVKALVDLGVTLNDLAGTFNGFDFAALTSTIKVGGFKLSGSQLRDPAADLTQLINLTDVQDVKKQMTDAAPALFGKLGGAFSSTNLSQDFPLFTNPKAGVFQLLLGKDADLVSFTASLDLHASVGRTFPFLGPLSVGLGGAIDLGLNFRIAYDTYGLRQFLTGGKAEQLSYGLYVDGSRPLLRLDSSINAEAALTAGIFSAGVSGGLAAKNVTVTVHPGNGGDRLRLFAPPALGGVGDTLFDTTGQIVAGLDAFARLGVDLPFVGFVGVEKKFTLANVVLLDLTSGGIANPLRPKDVQLAHVDNGQLILDVGPNAALRTVGLGVKDETFRVRHEDGAAGAETVSVSAFGVTQSLPGVSRIYANSGDGNDTIVVEDGVLAPAYLEHQGLGSAQFSYAGSGMATLFGGVGGKNVLTGGAGPNYLYGAPSVRANGFSDSYSSNTLIGGTGPNYLYGGTGAINRLTGGAGPNTLIGGNHWYTEYGSRDQVGLDRADNTLIAGPGDDYLLGGDGANNTLVAGGGHATLLGGQVYRTGSVDHQLTFAANNVIRWQTSDGAPSLLNAYGGSLQVTGTDEPDRIDVRPEGDHFVILASRPSQPGPSAVHGLNVTRLSIDGAAGQDTIVLNDLGHTGLTDVGVNLGKTIAPDDAPDTIIVNASAAADAILVETEQVTAHVHQEQLGSGTPGGFYVIYMTPVTVPGQVLKVAGLGNTVLRLALFEDQLRVNGLGGDDTFTFATTVGKPPTIGNVAGASGVLDPSTPWKNTPPPPDVNAHRGRITFDGGAGSNAVNFVETFPDSDTLRVTESAVVSALVPSDVAYATSDGGNFARGINVTTGTGANTVNVQGTLGGAFTRVTTRGDATVNVSSDAPFNAGTLDRLAGPLTIESQGRTGLIVSERGRTLPDTLTLTDSTVRGSVTPLNITYQAGRAGGSITGVALLTGSGNDMVDVRSTLWGVPTTVDTGGGNDDVIVHVNSRDHAHVNLTVDGGPQAPGATGDFLQVFDEEDAAVIHALPSGPGAGLVEVSYLSGTWSQIAYRGIEYVTQNPDADTGFVRALFRKVLKRNAPAAELAPLVSLMQQQPDRAAGRAMVAMRVEHSAEARTLTVRGWYATFLGQAAPAATDPVLRATVDLMVTQGRPEEEALRSFLNATVLYKPFATGRAGFGWEDDSADLIASLYGALMGRAPSAVEADAARQLWRQSGVGEVAYRLATSAEGRRARVRSYYATIIGRSASLAEVDSLAPSGLDLTAVRVQLEASQEFYDTGR